MTFPGNSSFILNACVEEEGNTGIVTVPNQQASFNLRSSSGIVKEQGTLTQSQVRTVLFFSSWVDRRWSPGMCRVAPTGFEVAALRFRLTLCPWDGYTPPTVKT